MKVRKIILARLVVPVLFGVMAAVNAKADTIVDPATNVSYSMSSTFVADSTNTFDVTLTIDATHFSGVDGTTAGFLSVLAVQFPGTNDFVLTNEPGGTVDLWGNKDAVGNGACDRPLPFGTIIGLGCIPNTSPNTVGAVPGTLTFEFAVTEPVAQTLNSSANIFARYADTSNGADFGRGTIVGETPLTSIGIENTSSGGGMGGSGGGGGTPVPEPSGLVLLSIGLAALAIFYRTSLRQSKILTV